MQPPSGEISNDTHPMPHSRKPGAMPKSCFYVGELVPPHPLRYFVSLVDEVANGFIEATYLVWQANVQRLRQPFLKKQQISPQTMRFALYPQAMRSIAGGVGELAPPQKTP